MTDKQSRCIEKLERYYRNVDRYNYSHLLSSIVQDRQFENMILSMTVDRLMGESPLAKYKYHWNYRAEGDM